MSDNVGVKWWKCRERE